MWRDLLKDNKHQMFNNKRKKINILLVSTIVLALILCELFLRLNFNCSVNNLFAFLLIVSKTYLF